MDQPETEKSCCGCLPFRGGMKILFAWELFWLWCWFMTSQFMWTGEFNTFNGGGFVTRSVPIILFCTFLSLVSAVLTGLYLFYQDNLQTRMGLVVSSGIMFIVAVVFVIGGVPIMWIDILAMGYCSKVTWGHYIEAKNSQEAYSELE